jgi:hypothetical protein
MSVALLPLAQRAPLTSYIWEKYNVGTQDNGRNGGGMHG